MHRMRLAIGLLSFGALFWMLPGVACPAEKRASADRDEPSVPARLTVLRSKATAHPMDRTRQAAALGRLTDPREVRDQQVVDALCRIAADPTDDLFVRMECVDALGELQSNVFADDHARAQYAMPFVSMLKDAREDELLRAKVAQVLGRTMPADRPQTQHAVNAMAALAEERSGSLLLRVACVDALAQIGAASELVDLVVAVLPQPNLDPLLQERSIKAFGEVLTQASNLKPIPLPTMLRIRDLALNPSAPLELRVAALRALAVLKKSGPAKSFDLMPELRRILREAEDAGLVVAAIEATGILDEADAVTALVAAYRDFFDAEKPDRENDLRIRSQIVRTLGGLLNAQASKKRPDAEAIRLTAELFLAIVRPVEENREAAAIREEALFALRYLHPRRAEFQRFHQPAIARLLEVAKADPQAGKEFPKALAETLTILARHPDLKTLERWEQWYRQTYPGAD